MYLNFLLSTIFAQGQSRTQYLYLYERSEWYFNASKWFLTSTHFPPDFQFCTYYLRFWLSLNKKFSWNHWPLRKQSPRVLNHREYGVHDIGCGHLMPPGCNKLSPLHQCSIILNGKEVYMNEISIMTSPQLLQPISITWMTRFMARSEKAIVPIYECYILLSWSTHLVPKALMCPR